MTRTNYDEKMMAFLESSNAKHVTFNFNKFNSLVRKRISESEFIIENRSKPFLKIPNPRPPPFIWSSQSPQIELPYETYSFIHILSNVQFVQTS